MSDERVVIYSKPGCPHCRAAKEYLKAKGIAFTDHNVAEDRDAAMEMVRRSGKMTLPVTIFDDGDVMIGFSPERFKELLEKNGIH